MSGEVAATVRRLSNLVDAAREQESAVEDIVPELREDLKSVAKRFNAGTKRFGAAIEEVERPLVQLFRALRLSTKDSPEQAGLATDLIQGFLELEEAGSSVILSSERIVKDMEEWFKKDDSHSLRDLWGLRDGFLRQIAYQRRLVDWGRRARAELTGIEAAKRKRPSGSDA